MSELRKATLAVDVIGNGLNDIKQIKAEWEALKARGSTPLKLDTGTSQISTTKKEVVEATDAYKRLSESASAFNSQASRVRAANTIRAVYASAPTATSATDYQQLNRLVNRQSVFDRESAAMSRAAGIASDAAMPAFLNLTNQMDAYEAAAQRASDRNGQLHTSIGAVTQSLAKHRTQLLMTTAALVAFAAATSLTALNVIQGTAELERFAAAKGLNAEATQRWIDAESKVPGLSRELATSIANSPLRDYTSSTEDLAKQAELIVAYWETNQSRIGKSKAAFVADVISGNAEQYRSLLQLKPFAVNREMHQAAIDVRNQLGYYDPAEITKRAQQLAMLKAMSETTLDTSGPKASWDDLFSKLSDISEMIGEYIVPYLLKFISGVQILAGLFASIPILPQLVAISTVIGIVVFGIASLAATVGYLYGQLGLVSTILGLVVSGLGALASAPVWVVVGVVTLLAAALGVVAYKLGYLDWLFKNVDFGKLFSGDLQQASTLLDNIKQKISGLIAGGVVKMLFSALMPALSGFGPLLDPVLDKLDEHTDISKSIYSTLKNFLGWIWGGVTGIWNEISKAFKYITGIGAASEDPTLLKTIKAAIWGEEAVKKEEQANKSAQYGVTGWTSVNGSPAVGVAYREIPSSAWGGSEYDKITDLTGGKTRLYGPEWIQFQKEHPDLAKQFTLGGTISVPVSDLGKYNIPTDALPPTSGDQSRSPIGSNQINGPGGITINTRNPEDIRGSADVQGGIPAIVDWIFGGVPKLDTGGTIDTRGLIYGHDDEETLRAAQVRTGPGVISQAIDALRDHVSTIPRGSGQAVGSPAPITFHTEINVNNPVVDSPARLTQLNTQLKFDIDRQIKETMQRQMRFFTR